MKLLDVFWAYPINVLAIECDCDLKINDMTNDETEQPRRERIAELAAEATDNRAELEARYGQVWTTDELRASRFEVLGFMAPYVVVREKSTGKKGSLEFQHSPRYYFSFVADAR